MKRHKTTKALICFLLFLIVAPPMAFAVVSVPIPDGVGLIPVKGEYYIEGQIIGCQEKLDILCFPLKKADVYFPVGKIDTMQKYQDVWDCLFLQMLDTDMLAGGYTQTKCSNRGTFKFKLTQPGYYLILVGPVKENNMFLNWFVVLEVKGDVKLILDESNATIFTTIKEEKDND